MPATYEPIATTTLGSAASTITFSTIPATYTDLRLVLVTKHTLTGQSIEVQYNNNTSSLYSQTSLYGYGTAAVSDRETNGTSFLCSKWTGTRNDQPILITLDIFSYAGSTNKTFLMTNASDVNGAGGSINTYVGLFRSTSAISSIKFFASAGSFDTGTTATLYGILKA